MTTKEDGALTMRSGYVAMIDALGWKGIWRNHKSDIGPIIETAQQVRNAAADNDQEMNRIFGADGLFAKQPVDLPGIASFTKMSNAVAMQSVFLSDTLVVGAWDARSNTEDDEQHKNVRLGALAVAVIRVLQKVAVAPVPLAFRGAIAPGEFLFDGNLILGEAIDNASIAMGIADVAVVWMPLELADERRRQIGVYIDYSMPLRDGRSVRVAALNPFFGLMKQEQIEGAYAGIVKSFGTGAALDVVIKKQNTLAFLDAARDLWTAGIPHYFQGKNPAL